MKFYKILTQKNMLPAHYEEDFYSNFGYINGYNKFYFYVECLPFLILACYVINYKKRIEFGVYNRKMKNRIYYGMTLN